MDELDHTLIGLLRDLTAAFVEAMQRLVAEAPADRERIRSEKVEIVFNDSDWALNDAGGALR